MEKLDKKFYVSSRSLAGAPGKLYKVKNGAEVSDDEWVVFLAKDDAFAATLPVYLENCIKLGADQQQVQMVRDMLHRVSMWRAANPDRCKVPDAAGEEILP